MTDTSRLRTVLDELTEQTTATRVIGAGSLGLAALAMLAGALAAGGSDRGAAWGPFWSVLFVVALVAGVASLGTGAVLRALVRLRVAELPPVPATVEPGVDHYR